MPILESYLRLRFWLDDFFNGSPIYKHYKDIRFISKHSANKGMQVREKKLYDILQYAKENCPFYKNIKSDSLSDFPVMNKQLYIRNYDKIKVCEKIIPGQIGKVHIQSTSGSTGTPFAIPQDTSKRQRRIAELKYFGSIVGFKSHEKLIQLRTWNKWQMKSPRQIRKENIIPFDISDMGEKRLDELCHMIINSKAKCLRGYASSFDLLSKYVAKKSYNFPSLKICIAGSEALQDDVRSVVKKELHCEIISQYANEECGILAQERIPTKEQDNEMYCNYAGYYFEILKFDSDLPAVYGELGRIVITDFHNHAFPIIRYDTGDVGIMSPPNEYSNGYPVLEKLYGRRLDVCYTTDGIPFHPMAIGRILKHFDKIYQWQFIQKTQTLYLLKLIVSPEIFISEYIQPAVIELKKVLGNKAVINIEKVDDIPVLASGKRKPVVNEWKKYLTF